MRLRKHKKSVSYRNSEEVPEGEQGEVASSKSSSGVKAVEPVNMESSIQPMKLFRKIINNPNLGFQIMVIILTLASDNIRMDRRIDGMTTTVDKVRSIAEVINNTMNSVKVAAEAPKTIRRLLE